MLLHCVQYSYMVILYCTANEHGKPSIYWYIHMQTIVIAYTNVYLKPTLVVEMQFLLLLLYQFMQ